MRYDYAGTRHTVQLEALGEGRYVAAIDQRRVEFEAIRLHDGGWQLQIGGESIIAYAALQGQERYIALGGQTYTLSVAEDSPTRRSRASAGDLTAQMPGQVTDLRVSEGDSVEAGQTLLIIEAMKMEIRIAAPQSGRVLRLLVRLGDTVDRGQTLLEMGD